MERVTRTRLASLAVLVLVLASGVVLGRAWERSSAGDGADAEEVRRDTRTGDDDREERKDRRRGRNLIVDRIDLSEEQEERVDSIVDVHVREVRSLQRELQARFEAEYEPRERAIVQNTREGIRAVLTPEQREEYDSLLAQRDRKRDRDRRGGDDRWDDDRRDGDRRDGRDDRRD